MSTSRRSFIKQSALASTLLFVPDFLRGFGASASAAANGTGLTGRRAANGRRLVVIQLGGGNDGLNTVVPFTNDLYYQARPTLALPVRTVLPLTADLGLNPALSALRPFYDRGQFAIFNNVGYPNPDRSHFRAMDIWHSAAEAEQVLATGWLGRWLDATCAGSPHPTAAIELDDTLSLALKGANFKGLAASNPDRLRQALRAPLLQQLRTAAPTAPAPDSDLNYLYRTLIETQDAAEYLTEKLGAARRTPPPTDYPKTAFGQHLHTIAGLINADTDTRVYYAALAGFDTHARQAGVQDGLLKQFADGTAALLADLARAGTLADTLVLVFSEFGRRVAQNASNGTDHGTANNVFILGSALKVAGIRGELPNLADLDGGDLRHRLDFRQLYATVLRDWLGADDKLILGRNFERVPLV